MADGDLFQADFDLAFSFARSETASYTNAAGAQLVAAIDAPRFDYAAGSPLGLLVSEGSDLGRQDRVAIDPLILPAGLVESELQRERECTVFHTFVPAGGEGEVERRAWYSRDAVRTINALLRQQGHHLAIGVIEGFRENLGGYVRLRGEQWALTGHLDAGAGILSDGDGQPLIAAGAEVIDG